MDLRDLIVTPLVIFGLYALAYFLRSRLCNLDNYRIFFPALTVKIIGALVVGLLYQYYYKGGDTFNYHTYGSRVIWEAFNNDPIKGLSLIFDPSGYNLQEYTSRIIFFSDSGTYFVVRVAALIDILTFSTYSATAVIFAFISFLGMWFMFRAFYERYPDLKNRLAFCILFVPSVIVWGSGLLKDTLVIGALGFATYSIGRIFIDRRPGPLWIFLLLLSLFVMFSVKKYVLLCFLPTTLLWVYWGNLQQIRSRMVQILLVPLIIAVTIASGIFAVIKVGENDSRYAIDKIAKTAAITAYDIGFYSGRNAGSGYSLGELDGSFGSMLMLFPQAVNVSLFRPYLWEVRNPLMLLSAIESFAFLIITSFMILRHPLKFFSALRNPTVIFCLVFSVTFAFAVGASTYNFGTLSRYRIPLAPYYLVALVLIANDLNSKRKLAELEETE
jgi:hypothetical protein